MSLSKGPNLIQSIAKEYVQIVSDASVDVSDVLEVSKMVTTKTILSVFNLQ